MKFHLTAVALVLSAGTAFAAAHSMTPAIEGSDQDVSGGTVTASKVVAGENGWLVVHRTDPDMKPGPVVGHAPLKLGENMDVAPLLTAEVAPGDKLSAIVHSENRCIESG